MMPLILSHYTATTCLGHGLAPLEDALRAGRGGLAPCAFEDVDLDLYAGEIARVDDEQLPPALLAFDCRPQRSVDAHVRLEMLAWFFDAVHPHRVLERELLGRVGVEQGVIKVEQHSRVGRAFHVAQHAGAQQNILPFRVVIVRMFCYGLGTDLPRSFSTDSSCPLCSNGFNPQRLIVDPSRVCVEVSCVVRSVV